MSTLTRLLNFSARLVAIAFALTALNAVSFRSAQAEPLSKKFEIDFFRDLPSRNLRGLATRSDGRLVAGPVLTELKGHVPSDLLWCFTPLSETQWLIGTGPDGGIIEATLDLAQHTVTARELLKIGEPHLFALCRLAKGDLLAGTSPQGGLVLVRAGKIHARIGLPVDSIFDLLVLPATATEAESVLVATGNPARIYRINPAVFADAGITPDKVTDAAQLTTKGVTLFGEIRDRNVRRLARFADGRIAVGSSPKGNLYVFPAPTIATAPASPRLLKKTATPKSLLCSLKPTVIFTRLSSLPPPAAMPASTLHRTNPRKKPTPPPRPHWLLLRQPSRNSPGAARSSSYRRKASPRIS